MSEMNQYEKDLEYIKQYVLVHKALGSSYLDALFCTKKASTDRKVVGLYSGATSPEEIKEHEEEIVNLIEDSFPYHRCVKRNEGLVWMVNDEDGIVFAYRVTTIDYKTRVLLIGAAGLVESLSESLKELEEKSDVTKIHRIVAERPDRVGVTTLPIKQSVIDDDTFHTLYPHFKQTPKEFLDKYMECDSPILFLMGNPGTGKTSYLKHLLAVAPKDTPAYLIDSLDVIEHPELFNYLREKVGGGILVIEDADNILGKRRDGNARMTELLNMTSGLGQTNLKIIITTNLPRLSLVDEALLRHGRTHSIVVFPSYCVEEAIAVREVLGLLPAVFEEGETYTLAETTAPVNTQTNEFISMYDYESSEGYVLKEDFGFLPA